MMKIFKINQLAVFLLLLVLSAPAFAHWTTKGPYGGTITCLTVMDTLIFAGTADGGVYRTTTAQASAWRYYNYTGLTDPHINALTTIGGYVVAATPTGTFKSTDLGNTWLKTTQGLSNANVLSLITAGDHIIAGTNGGGIYLSHDSGSTWEQSNVGLTNLVVTSFAYKNNMIYAGTQNGVYVSIDDGDSWAAMNTGLSSTGIVSLAATDTMLYAATTGGVYATNTATVNWMSINNGLGSIKVYSISIMGSSLMIATSAGVGGTMLSSIAWTFIGVTSLTDTTYAVVSYSNKLYAGTKNGGVYRQNAPAVTWSPFNTGLNNLKGYAVYNSGNLVLTATSNGVFVSKDLAANYVASNNGLTDSLNVTGFLFAGGKLYAGTKTGGVYASADTGATWTSINTGLANLDIVALVGFGNKLLAATATGAVFTTDRTTVNWLACTGLPANIIPTGFATDTVSHVFLGTNGNGVFMCMDGASFTANNTGLTNLNVSALAIAENTLYAATSGGIFKSGFMNSSWTACNNGLPTLNIRSLCASGKFIVAGYKGGTYSTYDGGGLWQAPNILLYIPQYADVTAISFTPASSRLFIATPANGFYSNAISELPTTGVNEVFGKNAREVFSVFPNPTSGVFTIENKQPNAAIQAVSMYDITGKCVWRGTTGKQNITINMGLMRGLYFVEVQTEKGLFVQKVLVQ